MDTAPNTLSGLTEPTEKLTRDGYYNVTACYTKPGYGYYSGAASICPKGYYNAGDNREPCTRCASLLLLLLLLGSAVNTHSQHACITCSA